MQNPTKHDHEKETQITQTCNIEVNKTVNKSSNTPSKSLQTSEYQQATQSVPNKINNNNNPNNQTNTNHTNITNKHRPPTRSQPK